MATPPPSSKELKNPPAAPSSTNTRSNLTRNSSAPAHPSPLRDSSPVLEMASLQSVSGTPMDDKQIPTGPRATRSAIDLTPPDSNVRQTHSEDSERTSIMPKFSYNTDEDPFVTPDSKDSKGVPTTASQILSNVPSKSEGSFTPREDRIGKEVNADNAQGILTPKACVFVANLSNQKTDTELEESVKKVFGAHGKCYVKIRRDRNKMPFAFVQYETVEAAQQAIEKSRGAIIDNRPTRCEHAKVNRALYLTRHTGGAISDAEARDLLESYGAIESTNPISIIDQHLFNLPEGIMVQFAYFQDARDAQVALKRHEIYRVAFPQSAFDFRPQGAAVGSPSPQRFRPDNPTYPRRSTESSSIYVGNLPNDITEQQLVEIFSRHGQVQSINIVKKASPNGDGNNVFAFLVFQTSEQADVAIQDKIMLGEHPLRVERKEYTTRRFRRNTYGTPNSNEQILNTLYRQALQMGLPQDIAARILSIAQRQPSHHQAAPNWSTPPMDNYYTHANNTMSPVRQTAAHGHSSPYVLTGLHGQVGYNMSPMPYYASIYGGGAELDDRSGMHTILEADEAGMAYLH